MKFIITLMLMIFNCLLAILLSKILHMPIDSIVGWMALGACSGIYAEQLIDG